MLHEFLTAYRSELIARCQAKVALRSSPPASAAEQGHGIPHFLDQLIKTLQVEQTPEPQQSRRVSGPSGGGMPVLFEVGETATQHGRELLQRGFTIEQVVHDYGDLCQAITELAFEHNAPIEVDEFHTLNRCLDNAIAVAVTEFSYQRDLAVAEEHSDALNERLGVFAHELRNHLMTTTLALGLIKTGTVSLEGATGVVLEKSLVQMRNLIDRSLAEARLSADLPVQHQLFSLCEFIAEVKLSASLEAQHQECHLTVSAVDSKLAVDADRDLLFSAVGNLLQNAFKFTHRHSEVTLNAYASADRILIDVEDHCGGLSPGEAESLFLPFTQGGHTTRKTTTKKTTGLGLGLSISRRSVEANDGLLSVRDLPGSGCVFTIDLPRHSLPEPA